MTLLVFLWSFAESDLWARLAAEPPGGASSDACSYGSPRIWPRQTKRHGGCIDAAALPNSPLDRTPGRSLVVANGGRA
jgi:hypothetical protein